MRFMAPPRRARWPFASGEAYYERDRDENDFAAARFDSVADWLAVLLAHLVFAGANASDEGRFGDVIDGIAERPFGGDVLAEKSPVVGLGRFRRERRDQPRARRWTP